jgi:hypothetical protein
MLIAFVVLLIREDAMDSDVKTLRVQLNSLQGDLRDI